MDDRLLEILDKIAAITVASARLEQVDVSLERRVTQLEAAVQHQGEQLEDIKRKLESFKVWLTVGTIVSASLGSGAAQVIGKLF